MNYKLASVKQVLVLRVDEGEELVSSVKNQCGKLGVEGAVISSVIGAVKDPTIINPKGGKSKVPEPLMNQITGIMEVAGSGNVALDDAGDIIVHIHASLGKSVGESYTGHLVEADVKYFCEVVIFILDKRLEREVVPGWEFKVLKP